MKALVLCGGRGTRAHPATAELPKPLLEVAGRPVLAHLLEIFAAQGVRDFVLAAGFRADLVEQWARGTPPDWSVTVVDTGEDAGTASRIAQCRDLLDAPFLATYGDGLADIDVAALRRFHDAHGGAATVTSVPLPSQFGVIDLTDGDRVAGFREKPVLDQHWINGGFFVFGDVAFDHWNGDDLEREVLPALSAAGLLFAYRHRGFWRSMDTLKDQVELDALGAGGSGPWLRAPHG